MRQRSVADLLAAHGLEGTPEEAFPNDGWSGATLTRLERAGRPYILKRTGWATDWIARATDDRTFREADVAAGGLPLPPSVRAPHLGAANDGDEGVAILMPDLSEALFAWERPVRADELEAVLAGLAGLHAAPAGAASIAWCPLPKRLALLGRSAAEAYRAEGLDVGDRFLAGWDAFARVAPVAAVDLVRRLDDDPAPLLAALARLPDALLHGDLKLGNVGFVDGAMVLIDWAMVMRAPVAVELGWFLVSNVASLPFTPDAVLERYAGAAGSIEDRDVQADLAWIVGLVLRGWRKGLDAEAGLVLPTGATAGEDLALWSRRAVDAAERRL